MFDWFKFKKNVEKTVNAEPAPPPPRKPKAPPPPPRKPKAPPPKTEKELATEKGEPWVTIVRIDLDPNNLHQGAFELDWNDKFVANLVRAGYQMKPTDTDADIVDRWFQNVCRHVVMETWEQEQVLAKSFTGQFIRERDAGDGRKEIS